MGITYLIVVPLCFSAFLDVFHCTFRVKNNGESLKWQRQY
jgi:hypothetical protein